jgi:hypothetical protein
VHHRHRGQPGQQQGEGQHASAVLPRHLLCSGQL